MWQCFYDIDKKQRQCERNKLWISDVFLCRECLFKRPLSFLGYCTNNKETVILFSKKIWAFARNYRAVSLMLLFDPAALEVILIRAQ